MHIFEGKKVACIVSMSILRHWTKNNFDFCLTFYGVSSYFYAPAIKWQGGI